MIDRRKLRRHETAFVLMIALSAFAGCVTVAWLAGVAEPRGHDEFSYLLAADTFAHGRLTNPAHPLWRHFESFHIIQQPTYMSKYPPAQSLFLAAGQLLAGHPIAGVWLSFALMCGAITWMLFSWVPRRWALLGGVLVLLHPKLGVAGYWAQSYWGGAVAALGGALVLGALRRVIARPQIRHALVLALGLAMLANSRPYEGLFFSLPVGVMLFRWLMAQRGAALSAALQRVALPIVAVLLLTGVAMARYNFRVTGDALRMPYQVYEATYTRAPVFLWQTVRSAVPYPHDVFRELDQRVSLTFYEMQHSVPGFLLKNLAYFGWAAWYLFNVFLLPLLATAPALLWWSRQNRWAGLALQSYGAITVGLLLQTFMNIHYLAPIFGLNFVFIVQAMRLCRATTKKFPRFALALVPVLGVASLAWSIYADYTDASLVWAKHRATLLNELRRGEEKQLVIVSYGPRHSAYEWIYNEADIDRAGVVFARKLHDAENCRLVEYFRGRRIWALHVDDDWAPPKLEPYPTSLCSDEFRLRTDYSSNSAQ